MMGMGNSTGPLASAFSAARENPEKFNQMFWKKRLLLLLCSVSIRVNWLVYIWVVNSGHVVEASMGYYISPLVSVLLGVAVLKEKVGKSFILALILAASGVLVLIFEYGKTPWISLTIGEAPPHTGCLKSSCRRSLSWASRWRRSS